MTKLTRTGSEPLQDYGNYSDVYVDGIGRIDNNGPTSHLVLFLRRALSNNRTERCVTLRLIVPTAELPRMAAALSNPETVATSASELDPEGQPAAVH